MAELNDKAIEAIRDGKWEMHCVEMELTRIAVVRSAVKILPVCAI